MTARFLVFCGVVALMGAYAGLHVAEFVPGHPVFALAGMTGGALATLLWQLAYRRKTFPQEARWARAVGWAMSVWTGCWSSFMFFCAAADLASLGGLPSAVGAKLAAGAAVAAAGVGLAQALAGPRVKKIEVPVAGLPEGLRGLRIAQISDLHVGPTIRRAEVERVVEKVLALKPDLIAVTGDLVDGTPEKLAAAVGPLARLKAPLGVYYVLGNHEYYWDAPGWLEKTRALGMVPLVNENRVLSRGGAQFLVAGVPDEQGLYFVPGHAQDHVKAAAGAHGRFSILLAHRPTNCDAAEKAGFQLQLSGHTHGGQSFPWSLLIGFFHRYPSGLNRHGNLWLYVSVGTGYWGPANRLAVPAELSVLTLAPSRHDAGSGSIPASNNSAAARSEAEKPG